MTYQRCSGCGEKKVRGTFYGPQFCARCLSEEETAAGDRAAEATAERYIEDRYAGTGD